MKPRVLQPYKILAVALTAGLGCTTPVHPEPSASAAAAPTTQGTPATVVAQEADRTPAAAADRPPPPPNPKDPQLIALRGELGVNSDPAAVAARAEHFRPLCDADGYPLVGNVMTKGPGGLQPSAFCADLRAKRAAK